MLPAQAHTQAQGQVKALVCGRQLFKIKQVQ